MASAQQLIGLIKSHVEGDEDRFFDLAMQISASEAQKGHNRLAEQLRQWAEASRSPASHTAKNISQFAEPRGDLAGILHASYPSEKLSDVILPNSTKDELEHIISETQQREKLEEKGLRPRQRILLSGPPGTGKTLTASALAGELNFPLYTVLLHGLITKYMGETAQKLRMIFDSVKSVRGVYLFDEIDALAATRGNSNDVGEARRILNSFLQFLDEQTGPSIVVATTNIPEILDRAILRRFDLVLPYEAPDSSAIKKVMQYRLIGFNSARVNWETLTKVASGLSAADVVAAAEDAARKTVLKDSNTITTKELTDALKRRRSLQQIGITVNAAGQETHNSKHRS